MTRWGFLQIAWAIEGSGYFGITTTTKISWFRKMGGYTLRDLDKNHSVIVSVFLNL